MRTRRRPQAPVRGAQVAMPPALTALEVVVVGSEQRDFASGAPVKQFLRGLRVWPTFLISLRHVRHRGVFIYHSRPWHYGWGYKARRQQHVRALPGGQAVFADLSSPAMRWLLKRFLPAPKVQVQLDAETVVVAVRSLSDETCRWNVDATALRVSGGAGRFPVDRRALQLLLDLEDISHVLSSPRVGGLIISQQSYDDWALAGVALQVGIPVWEPESRLGSLLHTGDVVEDELRSLRALSPLVADADMKQGEASLEARVEGRYSSSTIAGYMAHLEAVPSTGTIASGSALHEYDVLYFCHVFSDAGACGISRSNPASFRDYFELTCDFLRAAEHVGLRVGVKFHPASLDSGTYPTEAILVDHVRQLVSSSEFLCEVPARKSIAQAIEESPKAVGVSVQGSVLVELAFAGTRAIGLRPSIYTALGIADSAETPQAAAVSCVDSFLTTDERQRRRERAIEWEALVSLVHQKTAGGEIGSSR